MKTPEEMAEEYFVRQANTDNFDVRKAFLAGLKRGQMEGFAAGWHAGLLNKQEEMMQAARQAIYSGSDTNVLWAPGIGWVRKA